METTVARGERLTWTLGEYGIYTLDQDTSLQVHTQPEHPWHPGSGPTYHVQHVGISLTRHKSLSGAKRAAGNIHREGSIASRAAKELGR